MDEYLTKNVVFEQSDLEIVTGTARRRGLGGKGFSAAVRQITREWFDRLTPEERVRITELGREALAEKRGPE